jgi:hypothetical protein
MSEKFVKLQSQQNGEFSATNNRVDFIIPASMGKISLRDSFVSVFAIPASTSAAADGSVPQLYLKWSPDGTPGSATDNYFNNVAIVKNAHISSSNKGMIESVRRTDILRNMLQFHRKSYTSIRSESYMSASQLISLDNSQQYSPFVQTEANNSSLSQINQHTPIMIRLGDILDFCDADIIDCQALGDIKVHLELNINRLVAAEAVIEQLDGSDEVADIADTGADQLITELTLTGDFVNESDVPYYNGQRLQLAGTLNGVGAATADFTVSEVSRNAATGVVILRSAATIFTNANGNTSSGMTIDNVAATGLSVQFPLCEVVVKQLDPSVEAPTTLLYQQFDTFELNGNGLTNFTNVVEINGSATNALICPIDANGLNSQLTSITSYRLALNNVELTDNREITPNSPLQYDTNISALRASDYVSRNVGPIEMVVDQDDGFQINEPRLSLLAAPLFRTAQRKNLQINIESGGLNGFILYTAVPRILDMSA